MPSASASMVSPEAAAAGRYFLDGLIGYMPKIVELKVSGSLASTTLVARLPKSMEVLAMEDNPGVELSKLVKLLKKPVREITSNFRGMPSV